LELKRYLRPFVASLPFFTGVLLWLLPTFMRFNELRDTFWIPPFAWIDYVQVFFFLGIGSDFREQYLLAGLLNLPLISGFSLGVIKNWKNEMLRYVILGFLFVIIIFTIVSLLGQSFMYGQYLLFVLPLYMLISLVGLVGIKRAFWRKLGFGVLTFSMVISLCYYYIDYYQVHDYYGFVRWIPEAEPGEGHNFSRIADDVSQNIADDEVIIHYSSNNLRFRSFFPSLVYHQRRFPEHIYSKNELANYEGRQYLKPGEWITSLDELASPPAGIWVITLDDPQDFFDEEVLNGHKRPYWIHKENFMVELREAGYIHTEMLIRGKVGAIHFRKAADPNSAEKPGT
jgi:hypothetical protein